MAKVALVSHDVQTVQGRAGGVGAFVTHFAGLLREAGDEVTIILARAEPEPREVDEVWRARYRAWGIHLIERHNSPPRADRWSDAWPLRLSEQIAPLLEGFDVVYFSDWANAGFLPAREKRFSSGRRPVLVTVLHGPSSWVRLANGLYPKVPEDLHVDFIERYTALHSDFVIAPSRFMVDWLKAQGWRFRTEPEVLGLPYRSDPALLTTAVTPAIARLVFFGRLEILKGFRLFASAVRRLAAESTVLRQLQEIVLLGPDHEQAVGDQTRRELEALGVPVSQISNLDSLGVREYLKQRAGDTLVIIASPAENFPYAVIEASSIPGLNVICSRGGGIPEIFEGRGAAQLFDPHPAALAAKIEERLRAPLEPAALAAYDFDRANRRWLGFHQRICEGPQSLPVNRRAQPSVDVCIAYFNKQRHFPQLLEALDRQNVPDFGLIAVDDGSTNPEARAAFDALAERYAPRGWTFFRQPNAFVDAARNRAAQRSSADYLLFIDADDLPAPNAIERLREAAMLSGCDCLLTYGCLFAGDNFPFDPSTGHVAGQILARYLPLGPDLVTGLVDPIVFGPPMILIRRTVFEELGGYREIRGAAHEDWELQLRLLLSRYQTDVVPEYLLFFRRLEDGLASTSDEFAAKRRLLETYEAYLTESGLNGLATAMLALQRRCQELEAVVRQNVPLDVRLRLHDRLRTLLNQAPR
jgi:glycosyltransferase involved in cell wall biosynthesis/GT2 family glycosyltransferase